MIRDVAAKRYAEALFGIAREREKVDEWQDGLRFLADFCDHPQAAELMKSARLPLTSKLELVQQALRGQDEPVINLARLLVARGRTHLAAQIAAVYSGIADEHRGVVQAQVTSAVALSRDERTLVNQKLAEMTGKTVVLHTQVDQGIIGGLVVRIGDLLIDGSTKSKLTALKRRLAEARG